MCEDLKEWTLEFWCRYDGDLFPLDKGCWSLASGWQWNDGTGMLRLDTFAEAAKEALYRESIGGLHYRMRNVCTGDIIVAVIL